MSNFCLRFALTNISFRFVSANLSCKSINPCWIGGIELFCIPRLLKNYKRKVKSVATFEKGKKKKMRRGRKQFHFKDLFALTGLHSPVQYQSDKYNFFLNSYLLHCAGWPNSTHLLTNWPGYSSNFPFPLNQLFKQSEYLTCYWMLFWVFPILIGLITWQGDPEWLNHKKWEKQCQVSRNVLSSNHWAPKQWNLQKLSFITILFTFDINNFISILSLHSCLE